MIHKLLSTPIPLNSTRVKASRSSWVEHFVHEGRGYFLKTYVYPLPLAPLRGLFRNTFLAPSRVEREWRALKHLARSGAQPDLCVAWEEDRVLGLLVRARLLTLDYGGEDLAALIGSRPLSRSELIRLARFVRTLHESGLRDPDLKARNILVRTEDGHASFAKIDASSSRVRRAGQRWDRRRLRDLEIFLADLARLRMTPSHLRRLLVAQWFPEKHRLRPSFRERLLAAARGGE